MMYSIYTVGASLINEIPESTFVNSKPSSVAPTQGATLMTGRIAPPQPRFARTAPPSGFNPPCAPTCPPTGRIEPVVQDRACCSG